MGVAEIIGIIAAVSAVGGGFFGTIKWTAARFAEQGSKLEKLEREYAKLYREHTLVLVRLERFRLAFQMVASDLARKSPQSPALANARALLDDSFKLDPHLPQEMQEILNRIDEATSSD